MKIRNTMAGTKVTLSESQVDEEVEKSKFEPHPEGPAISLKIQSNLSKERPLRGINVGSAKTEKNEDERRSIVKIPGRTSNQVLEGIENKLDSACKVVANEMINDYNRKANKNVLIAEKKLSDHLKQQQITSIPRWYQELSYEQLDFVMGLEDAILTDQLDNVTSLTHKCLKNIGIVSTFVRIPAKTIFSLQRKTKFNAVNFLREIYKTITGNYFEDEGYKDSYNCNERLIMTSIAALTLVEVIDELNYRLSVKSPQFPPKPRAPEPVKIAKNPDPYKEVVPQTADFRIHRSNMNKWRKEVKETPKPELIQIPVPITKSLSEYCIETSKDVEGEFKQINEKNIKEELEEKQDTTESIMLKKEQETTESITLKKEQETTESITLKKEQETTESITLKKEQETTESITLKKEQESTESITLKIEKGKQVDNCDDTVWKEKKLKEFVKTVPKKSSQRINLTSKNKFPPGRKNLSLNMQDWLNHFDEDYKRYEKMADKLISEAKKIARVIDRVPACDGCCASRQEAKKLSDKNGGRKINLIDDIVVDNELKDTNQLVGYTTKVSSISSTSGETISTEFEETVQDSCPIITNIAIDDETPVKNISGFSSYENKELYSTGQSDKKKIKNVPPCDYSVNKGLKTRVDERQAAKKLDNKNCGRKINLIDGIVVDNEFKDTNQLVGYTTKVSSISSTSGETISTDFEETVQDSCPIITNIAIDDETPVKNISGFSSYENKELYSTGQSDKKKIKNVPPCDYSVNKCLKTRVDERQAANKLDNKNGGRKINLIEGIVVDNELKKANPIVGYTTIVSSIAPTSGETISTEFVETVQDSCPIIANIAIDDETPVKIISGFSTYENKVLCSTGQPDKKKIKNVPPCDYSVSKGLKTRVDESKCRDCIAKKDRFDDDNRCSDFIFKCNGETKVPDALSSDDNKDSNSDSSSMDSDDSIIIQSKFRPVEVQKIPKLSGKPNLSIIKEERENGSLIKFPAKTCHMSEDTPSLAQSSDLKSYKNCREIKNTRKKLVLGGSGVAIRKDKDTNNVAISVPILDGSIAYLTPIPSLSNSDKYSPAYKLKESFSLTCGENKKEHGITNLELKNYFMKSNGGYTCSTERPKTLEVRKPVDECKSKLKLVRQREEKETREERERRLQSYKKIPFLNISGVQKRVVVESKPVVSGVTEIVKPDGNVEMKFCIAGTTDVTRTESSVQIVSGVSLHTPYETPTGSVKSLGASINKKQCLSRDTDSTREVVSLSIASRNIEDNDTAVPPISKSTVALKQQKNRNSEKTNLSKLEKKKNSRIIKKEASTVKQEEIYDEIKKEKEVSEDKIEMLDVKPELDDETILKKELELLKKEGYVFAMLPECDKIPQLRIWMMRRKGVYFSEKDKEKIMACVLMKWTNINDTILKNVKARRLSMSKKEMATISYNRAKEMKNLINSTKALFYSQVRQERVERSRLYWNIFEFIRFPIKRFKQIYFTYLPGSERDGYVFKPWSH